MELLVYTVLMLHGILIHSLGAVPALSPHVFSRSSGAAKN